MLYFWLYLDNHSTYKVAKPLKMCGKAILGMVHPYIVPLGRIVLEKWAKNCIFGLLFLLFLAKIQIGYLYNELDKQKFGQASMYCQCPVLLKVWVVCKTTFEKQNNIWEISGPLKHDSQFHMFHPNPTLTILKCPNLKNWQLLGLLTETQLAFHPETSNFL